MASATHKPAPWRHVYGYDTHNVKRDRRGRMLGTVTMPLEDYDHAIACVNACAGLADPDVVPELLAALKTAKEGLEFLHGIATGEGVVCGHVAFAVVHDAIARAEGR